MKSLVRVGGWFSVHVCLALVSAAQNVIQVPGDASTIQAAIVLAEDGDTVQVGPGTYDEALDFLGKAIRVVSQAGAALTTIDATNLGSPVAGFFNEEGPDSVLRGFTLTGGNWNGSPGAGIACFGFNGIATPLIQHCVIRDNETGAMSGAGVGGDAILEDCVIELNVAGIGTGGGVYGSPVLRRCIVRQNSAYDSGGLYMLGGSLEDCLIVENYGGEGALSGGVTIAGNGVVLTRCVIARNQSSGLFQYRVKGAGVCVTDGVQGAMLVNCTLVANDVLDQGPYPEEDVGGLFGSATLVNTILLGNDVNQLAAGSTVSATYSNIEGVAGQGNFFANPLFVDLAGGDYHLTANSPCIDSGDPTSPLDPDCTRADVGAFHFGQSCVRVVNGTGVNPQLLFTQQHLVIGSTWTALINASGIAGAVNSGLMGRLSALDQGVMLPIGELLVFGPKLFTLFQPSTGALDSFQVQIPASTSLIGFVGHVQGAVFAPGNSRLTNALRVVVGQ